MKQPEQPEQKQERQGDSRAGVDLNSSRLHASQRWENSPIAASEQCGDECKVEVLHDPRAFVVRGVLSDEECERLIGLSHANEESYSVASENGAHYRNHDRLVIESEALASAVYARLTPALNAHIGEVVVRPPQNDTEVEESKAEENDDGMDAGCRFELDDAQRPRLTVHTGMDGVGFGSEGRWRHSGLNELLRFMHYREGGHLGPHMDGEYARDADHRSMYTVLVYLRDLPEGGATRFVRSAPVERNAAGIITAADEDVIRAVQPERGMALVFYHHMMHDGQPLTVAGTEKYFLRSEVMFTREEESKRDATEAEVEAEAELRRAEALEAEGDYASAAKAYTRAWRLDPKLKDYMQG